MSLIRMSLYRHELEIIAKLTLDLARLKQEEVPLLIVENFAPEVFGKLARVLYGEPASICARLDSDMGIDSHMPVTGAAFSEVT